MRHAEISSGGSCVRFSRYLTQERHRRASRAAPSPSSGARHASIAPPYAFALSAESRRRRRRLAGHVASILTHSVLAVASQREAKDREGWTICTTGHSLGGALCTLFAAEVAVRFPETEVLNYNFGAPKVGNEEFVRRFNRLVPKTFRVVNDADVIVRLPRNKGVGAVPGAGNYYHVGRTVLTSPEVAQGVWVEGESPGTPPPPPPPPPPIVPCPFSSLYCSPPGLGIYMGLLRNGSDLLFLSHPPSPARAPHSDAHGRGRWSWCTGQDPLSERWESLSDLLAAEVRLMQTLVDGALPLFSFRSLSERLLLFRAL